MTSTKKLKSITRLSELRKGDVVVDAADDNEVTVERVVPLLPLGTLVVVRSNPARDIAVVRRQEDGWYKIDRPGTRPWYTDDNIMGWLADSDDPTEVIYTPKGD